MAGREKKQLGNKQLGVKKETDKIKSTATQKVDEVTVKTKESKQIQKDVNRGRKPTVNRRSTGGIKSKKDLATELKHKNASAVGPSVEEKSAVEESDPKSSRVKFRQKKLNKAGRPTSITQSGKNFTNEPLSVASDSKCSQRKRLCKNSKFTKAGLKQSVDTNLEDESNPSALITKSQNVKVGLRKFGRLKLATGNTEIRSGMKGRITRSDSPARVLRNGKRRKLKDPSLLEGLDVGLPKRRRLLSTTRDGTVSELGIKSESILDDQSSIAGSDISFIDFPKFENGKSNWDFDFDSKLTVDETKSDDQTQSTNSVQRSDCSDNQSETSHDNCLGRSISNKITELINRNKFFQSIGKDSSPKVEDSLCKVTKSESLDLNETMVITNEKNLTDTNSNLCGSESTSVEKLASTFPEHECTHSLSDKTLTSRQEEAETKERVALTTAGRKVNPEDLVDLKEHPKNGQNPLIDAALHSISEKSAKKFRDLKGVKSKRFFQACPSSSGVFYVVQNTADILFQKEEQRFNLSSDSRESLDVPCVESSSIGKEISEKITINTLDNTAVAMNVVNDMSQPQEETSFTPITKSTSATGILDSRVGEKNSQNIVCDSKNNVDLNPTASVESNKNTDSKNTDISFNAKINLSDIVTAYIKDCGDVITKLECENTDNLKKGDCNISDSFDGKVTDVGTVENTSTLNDEDEKDSVSICDNTDDKLECENTDNLKKGDCNISDSFDRKVTDVGTVENTSTLNDEDEKDSVSVCDNTDDKLECENTDNLKKGDCNISDSFDGKVTNFGTVENTSTLNDEDEKDSVSVCDNTDDICKEMVIESSSTRMPLQKCSTESTNNAINNEVKGECSETVNNSNYLEDGNSVDMKTDCERTIDDIVRVVCEKMANNIGDRNGSRKASSKPDLSQESDTGNPDSEVKNVPVQITYTDLEHDNKDENMFDSWLSDSCSAPSVEVSATSLHCIVDDIHVPSSAPSPVEASSTTSLHYIGLVDGSDSADPVKNEDRIKDDLQTFCQIEGTDVIDVKSVSFSIENVMKVNKECDVMEDDNKLEEELKIEKIKTETKIVSSNVIVSDNEISEMKRFNEGDISVIKKNEDISKEDEFIKLGGIEPCSRSDTNVIEKMEEDSSETNLVTDLLKDFDIESQKTAEEILTVHKQLNKKSDTEYVSLVNDFVSTDSINVANNKDSLFIESAVKEDSECSKTETSSKLEGSETDVKLDIDAVSEVVKDKLQEGEMCKLHNGIEPTLFYCKGNINDVRTAVNNCDSKDKLSTELNNSSNSKGNPDFDIDDDKSKVVLLRVEDELSNISEKICDSKTEQPEESKQTENEFKCDISKCPVGSAQEEEGLTTLSSEVFQSSISESHSVNNTPPTFSKEISDDILTPPKFSKEMSDDILHDINQLDISSRLLHEASDSMDGDMVENKMDLATNLLTELDNSKISDAETTLVEEVSPEEQAYKESVLSALGLQPLRSTQVGASTSSGHNKPCDNNYTGTLKTVIKFKRSSPEKRSPLKLVLKSNKSQGSEAGSPTENQEAEFDELDFEGNERIEYSISKEAGSSDTKDPFMFEDGNRKCLKTPCSYRYFDISCSPQLITDKNSASELLTPDAGCKDDGKAGSAKQTANLVIPEKSASFSIHPGRLCSDVCSYCFGKFGSLDTPCHVAQLKSIERQQKILQVETHLTADSCLCDACYRHVDRKANCPSYKPNKKRGQHHRSSSSLKTLCCVQGCSQTAHHHIRRKWLLKLKRSIAKKVPIDMEKMPQHLPFPLCSKHYSWVDYFMVCGICKRRLTRNHMYPLGPEVHELNTALESDGIPVRLSDKLFLCKLCRYFSSVRLKYKDPSQLAGNHKLFFQGYRKRILHFHDIEEIEEETAEESPPKPKRRKTKTSSSTIVKPDSEDDSGTKSKCDPTQPEDQQQGESFGPATIEFSDRSGASTPMIDYSSLGSGTSSSNAVTFDDSRKHKLERSKPTKIRFKLGGASTGKIGSLSYTQNENGSIVLPQRDGLEVTPVHDSVSRPFYPGEEELSLHADFEFPVKKEAEESNTKRGEWEKCTAMIQFDKDTKSLFRELQRPYGNHSSFFRHLILLEKYWRSGELILSPSASSRASNYISSVQNRIRAYEGRPSQFASPLPSSHKPATSSATSQVAPVPVIDLPLKRRLGSGILTAADGARPITFTSMSGISIAPRPVVFPSISSAVGSTAVSVSQSRVPVFTSFSQSSPSPMSRKFIVDAIATSAGSHFQQNKRIPNVLQVTAGGKSFSIVPNLTQIRHIQTIQQQQQQQLRQQSSNFEPMICDVRSLATENGSSMWDRSTKTPVHQQPNISVSILPKPSTVIQSPSALIKPTTIVTPTGIILSRKPEISVTAVQEKRDVISKPKTITIRKESVSKVKVALDKLDPTKAKDISLQMDVENGLPKANC